MSFDHLPRVNNLSDLESMLATPSQADIEFAKTLQGDVLVLGAGGKMGPTLVERIAAAQSRSGSHNSVYAVSRFGDSAQRDRLASCGAHVLPFDLLGGRSLDGLPRCENVIFMVGAKFGTTGNEGLTWAANVYLPGRVARHFRDSRMVAFSTGNVYPLVDIDSGGSLEDDPPNPVGEYAQSCLGRERVLTYFSRQESIPMTILRLNYAAEARYGVVLDIGLRVFHNQAVPLDMGYLNVIWQGDANSAAFRSLGLVESPPRILNLTGAETVAVRDVAQRFATAFQTQVSFEGQERPTALLNNSTLSHSLLGKPAISWTELTDWTADWIRSGGSTHQKPTHFEVRDGKF